MYIFAEESTKQSTKQFTKTMKIRPLLTKKILNDKQFRLGLAAALNLSERQIQNLAKSNSENLTKYKAIEFYRSEGFTVEQLFDETK